MYLVAPEGGIPTRSWHLTLEQASQKSYHLTEAGRLVSAFYKHYKDLTSLKHLQKIIRIFQVITKEFKHYL